MAIKNMPLRTVKDCEAWLEKAINETGESTTSIARANARTAVVKAKVGLHRLSLDYAKLVKAGAKIPELDRLTKVEFQQIEQA